MTEQIVPITPEKIPVYYKNVIEDLLLAILNTLPAPNNNPNTFLNGQLNWATPLHNGTGLPQGNTYGDILIFNDINEAWEVYPRLGVFQYDADMDRATILLDKEDTIDFSGVSIQGTGDGHLKLVGGNWIIGNHLQLDGSAYLKNKSGNGYVPFIQRDTANIDTKGFIRNVSAINHNGDATDDFSINTQGNKSVILRNGNWIIQSVAGCALSIGAGGALRLVFAADGSSIAPAIDNSTDLGTQTKRIKTGYFTGLNCNGNTTWSLGQLEQNGDTVTIDSERFLNVTINGVQYKIALAKFI